MPVPQCLWFALTILLAGCVGSPAPFVAGWWSGLSIEPTLGPEFASRVPAEGKGVHGALEQPIWLPGDELTFALELFDGDQAKSQWLVRLRVIGLEAGEVVEGVAGLRVDAKDYDLKGFAKTRLEGDRVEHSRFLLESFRYQVSAAVTGLDGQEIYADTSMVWDGLHRVGLFQFLGLDAATTAARATPLAGDGTESDPYHRATTDPKMLALMLVRLLETFQANAALSDVLNRVADMPSLADSLGFLVSRSFMVDWDDLRGVRPTVPPPLLRNVTSSAFSLPFRISVGSSSLLFANFIVVPPTGVLALTAGIVGMSGHRPSDPGKRFMLTLVGARRGAPSRVERTPAASGK